MLARWPSAVTSTRAARVRALRRRVRAAVRGREDSRWLADGRIRAWIAGVEDALAVARASAAAGSGSRRSRLVSLVADLGVLGEVAPEGRLPADFPRRARRVAMRELDRCLDRWRDDPGLAPLRGERRAADDIVVAPVLRVRGRRVRTGRRDRSFERRVPKALALLDEVWPDARHMIARRTHRVVPVDERATVSFSSSRAPGVSYVHVRSRPLVRLAEDLLHEATHQRLHEIEALFALVEAGEHDDEPRFYSPWRRQWRPLRGLVHGACTFVVGARYFERLLAASPGRVSRSPARRAWVARRMLEEVLHVGIALDTLRGARREGLLTGAGRTVVAAVEREHARLGRDASRIRRVLRRSARGRAELDRLARRRAWLARRPLRWPYGSPAA